MAGDSTNPVAGVALWFTHLSPETLNFLVGTLVIGGLLWVWFQERAPDLLKARVYRLVGVTVGCAIELGGWVLILCAAGLVVHQGVEWLRSGLWPDYSLSSLLLRAHLLSSGGLSGESSPLHGWLLELPLALSLAVVGALLIAVAVVVVFTFEIAASAHDRLWL